MPCRSNGDGDYELVDDFVIDDWLRAKLKVHKNELVHALHSDSKVHREAPNLQPGPTTPPLPTC